MTDSKKTFVQVTVRMDPALHQRLREALDRLNFGKPQPQKLSADTYIQTAVSAFLEAPTEGGTRDAQCGDSTIPSANQDRLVPIDSADLHDSEERRLLELAIKVIRSLKPGLRSALVSNLEQFEDAHNLWERVAVPATDSAAGLSGGSPNNDVRPDGTGGPGTPDISSARAMEQRIEEIAGRKTAGPRKKENTPNPPRGRSGTH